MNPPSADVAPTHPNRGEFASVASGCHLTAVTRFPNSAARHAVANANAFAVVRELERGHLARRVGVVKTHGDVHEPPAARPRPGPRAGPDPSARGRELRPSPRASVAQGDELPDRRGVRHSTAAKHPLRAGDRSTVAIALDGVSPGVPGGGIDVDDAAVFQTDYEGPRAGVRLVPVVVRGVPRHARRLRLDETAPQDVIRVARVGF